MHKGCGSGCGSGCLLIVLGFVVVSIFFPTVLKNSPEKPSASPVAPPTPTTSEQSLPTPPSTTTEDNAPIQKETPGLVASSQTTIRLRDSEAFPTDVILARRITLVDDSGISGLVAGTTIRVLKRNADAYDISFGDKSYSVPKKDIDDATLKQK